MDNLNVVQVGFGGQFVGCMCLYETNEDSEICFM